MSAAKTIAIIACTLMTFAGAMSASAGIVTAQYSSVGPNVTDFEDVAATTFPGVVYDGVLSAGGLALAERFAGQVLSFAGDNDVLSGPASGPLALQTGSPNQNLALGTDYGSHHLVACGFKGCTNGAGYGEGAFAVLFSAPVNQFGFEQYFFGSSTSSTTVQFFRNDGSIIDVVTVESVFSASAPVVATGFTSDGGNDIAGVSIHSDQFTGTVYDNFRWGAVAVATPGSLILLLGGVLGAVALRRSARSARRSTARSA